MSVMELAIVIFGSLVAIAAGIMIVITGVWDIKQWQIRRRKVKEVPEPPTLHEVHAADMDHWDRRYQQALMDGLGEECCLCDRSGGKYSCLIHRKPSNHPPLSYIRSEAAGYRERHSSRNMR